MDHQQSSYELHDSVRRSDYNAIVSCLQRGYNVNSCNLQGATPLLCANFTEPRIVKLLIDAGANLHVISYGGGMYPLHFAAMKGCIESVRLLVDAGCNLNMKDYEGRPPLYYAVSYEWLDIVGYLVERGADLNNESLDVAAELDNEPLVDYFLQRGAPVTHIGYSGTTPLHSVVKMTKPEYTLKLIHFGASIDHQDLKGWSPMYAAAFHGQVHQFKLLLEHGANVHCVTSHGETLLHAAAFNASDGSAEMTRILLERGLQVDARNNLATTPLLEAFRSSRMETVELLLKHGADVHTQDVQCASAVHFAAENCKRHELLEYLLDDKGFDVNARDNNLWTPLHFAVENGNSEGCLVLLKNRAITSFKNNYFETPFELALKELRDSDAPVLGGVERCNESALVVQVFVKYFATLSYANVKVDDCDLEIIVMNKDVRSYYEKCVQEIELLKTLRVYHNVSMFDLLFASRSVVSGYVRNPDLVKGFCDVCRQCGEFLKYSKWIESKFAKEVRRYEWLLPVSNFFCEIFNFNDPSHIINQNILRYFRDDELKRICDEL